MPDATLVAVFDTDAHADAAVRDLESGGVPSTSITRRADRPERSTAQAPATSAGAGFWTAIFGSDGHADAPLYDRQVGRGAVVVSVMTPEAHLAMATGIMERHHPIDITDHPATAAVPADVDEQSVQLAAETMVVGKRAVDQGTTRVRRYVVEAPAQERVQLHDETMSIAPDGLSDVAGMGHRGAIAPTGIPEV